MRLGIMVRNMGPASTPALMASCARHAEAVGLSDVWVCDHIAIPPEESAGSGGRYVDPLSTLAWLGGITTRIGLGVTVLILPYRPALPTAKAVAAVQELSGGRLRLGVGVGWMEAEFRALGIPRERRGALTDETLAVLAACFSADEVSLNGQRFLFLPRPARPPVLIGGSGPHCLARVVRSGDGWMPMTIEPGKLAEPIVSLKTALKEAGRPAPEIIPLGSLPLEDRVATEERLAALGELGVTGIVQARSYLTEAEFKQQADALARFV